MAAVRFRTISVNRTLTLCGSGLRFRRFALYVLRKCDFIGKASEYLYWFISSPIDSVRHWFRVSEVRHFL